MNRKTSSKIIVLLAIIGAGYVLYAILPALIVVASNLLYMLVSLLVFLVLLYALIRGIRYLFS